MRFNNQSDERDKTLALDSPHRPAGDSGAAIRVAGEQLPAGEGKPADEGGRGVPRCFDGRDVPPDVGIQGAEVRKERHCAGDKIRSRYGEFSVSEYAEQLADVEHPYRHAGLHLHGSASGRVAPVLDSIYAHMLDSVGIRAEVASCITDSTGRVLRSSVGKELRRKGILKTDSLMLDFDEARFVQGIITNPYWVIARRMTLVLIATVLIIAVAVVCVVWQVRIILRQDKVAKLREDFSYAMIHDMKTPLSSIVMGTRILETGRLDSQPEKRAQYFRILREEGEHLISLTNKVLTLAKLEHRQLRLDKTECLLRPMLEDLAAKYQAKAEKPIRYVWKLDAPAVYARRGVPARGAEQPDRQCREIFGQ